jgi:hypothetical protein
MTKQTSEFRIGRVFGRACLVFARHFLTFFVVAGTASLPWLLIFRNPLITLDLPQFVVLPVIVMSTLLGQAIVLLGAFQDLRGRPISLSSGLRVGLRQGLSLIGLVVSLGLVVIAVVLFASAIAFGSIASTDLIFASTGLAVLFAWPVAMPACVIEGLGLFGSLSRSHALTKGYHLKIIVLLLVTIVAAAVLTWAYGPLAAGLDLVFISGGVVVSLSFAIWMPFLVVLLAVIYHELLRTKEEEIAVTFD